MNIEIVHQPNKVAFGFFKLLFARNSERSKRVDVLAHKVKTEVEACQSTSSTKESDRFEVLCTYKTRLDATKSRPDWQCLPGNVITAIELKRPEETISSKQYIGQLVHYCTSILKYSPGRRVVFGVLTNFRQLMFVAAYRKSSNKILSAHSEMLPEEQVVEELAAFVTAPRSVLGFNHTLPTEFITPVRALGRGSTAIVFSAKCKSLSPNMPEKEFAVKISCNEIALKVERTVLVILQEYLSSKSSTTLSIANRRAL